MNIRVLGCSGAQLPHYNTTCFLLGQNVLVDAGAVTSVLSLRQQQKIDYVFVTHAHLDHIRDLAFLADNIYYQRREKPLVIVGTKGVIDAIHQNLFNNIIWPDFSRIPNSKTPVVKFQIIQPRRKKQIGDLLIKAVNLYHSVESVGYIIEAEGKTVIFLGDTGPTEEVWQIAEKTAGLKAIFIETSLPDRMSDVADKSGHLTPRYLAAELKKLGRAKPIIYLYHIKPIYRKIIGKEIAAIKDREIRIIEDGQKIRI